ncbi:MAG TPA: sulfite exporter TauE/SafE family protein, partial [Pirellulaceae bacterium]|nr:sulfite exporter TauE/SafE family protein [Pirellulaceae bacterium]
MIGLLTTVFVVSLLGSLHCVGMCGPFALLAGTHGRPSGPGTDSPARHRWAAVAGYHAGRLATYTLLGLVCGGLGMIVDFGGALYGWQRTASYLAGGVMIGVGIWALLRQAAWVSGWKVHWGA